jgi:formate-dependent nitrite reductase membrane component NrfD
MDQPPRSQRSFIRVPLWLGVSYSVLSLVLIPWTFYLSASLPTHHLSSHWDASWVGLDVGITLLLLFSALLAYLKSDWVVISSSATGSLLVADAWFDIMSAHAGQELKESVAMAIFVELPLAAISYNVAHRIVLKNLRLTVDLEEAVAAEQYDGPIVGLNPRR